MERFTKEQGKLLVELARRTIGDKLGQPQAAEQLAELSDRLRKDPYQVHRATFVTLSKAGQLRGCIGSLAAMEPVTVNLSKNALNAAFHDPRFQPLSADDFGQIEIDISILTEPTPLEYSTAQDLLDNLRPGVDGVIIRKGAASATFLPQVWEQLPTAQQFLSHLCMKAGLSSKAWQDSELEVETYQVQYFKEER